MLPDLTLVRKGLGRWRVDDPGLWDSVLSRSESQSVTCTSGWIAYQMEYFADVGSVEDWSIILYSDGVPSGLWPISRRTLRSGQVILDSFGSPLCEPFSTRNRFTSPLSGSIVTSTVNELVESSSASECSIELRLMPDGSLSDLGVWASRKYPMLGCSVEMSVDLPNELAMRWMHLRKSYRPLVRRDSPKMDFSLHTDSDPSGIDVLRQLHLRAAGRSTRGIRTWERQREAIARGEAFVVLASFEGREVGGCLIHHSSTEAVYAVGAYDRDLMATGLAIGHCVQWRVWQVLVDDFGITHYILGSRTIPQSDEDEKVAAINQFKEGFSTRNSPRIVLCAIPQRQQAWSSA